MRRSRAAAPAQFITASQALRYLADPQCSASGDVVEDAGRAGATRWDMVQTRLIDAHVKGRVNLFGRKGDVANFELKPDAFERIPNEYFAQDVILGDSLMARPRRKGLPVTVEFWRDVKMPRSEFEAEFKSASAEAAFRRWWTETTKRDGLPPTERDAYLQFAQRQKPGLPRAWLWKQLKSIPKSWRRSPGRKSRFARNARKSRRGPRIGR